MQVQDARTATAMTPDAARSGYAQSVYDRYSSDLYDLGAIEVKVTADDEVTAIFDHQGGSMQALATRALVSDTIDGARIVVAMDDGRALPDVTGRSLARISAPRAQAIDGVMQVVRLQRVGERSKLPLGFLLRTDSWKSQLRLGRFFATEIGGVPLHLEFMP